MINPVIFKANDIRGVVLGEHPEWDADGAARIGGALVEVFGLGLGDALVLGRDIRLTGTELAASFTDAVTAGGVDVVDVGLASTDELWFASGRLGLPGVMVTASHNPAEYNGIKFCHVGARPITSEELAEVAGRAQGPAPPPAHGSTGTRTTRDVLGAYAAHLHSLVDLTGTRRLRVVADAGNGMAGHTLPAVFGPLDVELIGLYTDPDGTFPNHPPNPLEPENLLDARAAVRDSGADLGLVFDGDADRCFVIDERGEVVSPSAVTGMIARAELAREPGATIVINTITSRAVPEVVAEHGGRLVRTRVGHTFVKAAMADSAAIFGGEHSAHYYFRDFWGADTGMLAALHVMSLVGHGDRPLSDLARSYARYADSGEINSRVRDVGSALRAVQVHFADQGEVNLEDGLTISAPRWWFNLRPSNTEPLLRLNVESTSAEETDRIRDEVLQLVRR